MSVADGVADLDLFISQGATWTKTFGYEEPEGYPIDISAWGAQMDFRRAYGDADILLSLTKGAGITLGEDGMIRPTITADQSNDLPIPPGPPTIIYAGAPALLLGVYDLFLFPPTQLVVKLMQGRVFIIPRVSP